MTQCPAPWHRPIPLNLVVSGESESFRNLPAGTTAVPVAPHPGAFGVQRQHHVHEGVDLYCPEGTPVLAVEDGLVVRVAAFTGPAAGLPWWHDTEVVMVEGPSGVVAYGEVTSTVREGDRIQAGQALGRVKQVLRRNKGRPMSMLHLELHVPGTRTCPAWEVPGLRPSSLRDPTAHLLNVCQADKG